MVFFVGNVQKIPFSILKELVPTYELKIFFQGATHHSCPRKQKMDLRSCFLCSLRFLEKKNGIARRNTP